MSALLAELRSTYHDDLCEGLLGRRTEGGAINVADSSSVASKDLAERMTEALGRPMRVVTSSPQTLGTEFANITAAYIERAFHALSHLRPGEWRFSTSQASAGISSYEQYEHLLEIQRVLNEQPHLKTALGGDYLVTPDIIVSRTAIPDSELNAQASLLSEGDQVASRSPLIQRNRRETTSILHASISCKWTMRSDRAQNTRTEALNLIRNRKGQTPRIAVVTAEPLPTRVASIALGTGDIDCTYHAALDELLAAARASTRDEQQEMLESLIEGRRLRDISDLPLDLAT